MECGDKNQKVINVEGRVEREYCYYKYSISFSYKNCIWMCKCVYVWVCKPCFAVKRLERCVVVDGGSQKGFFFKVENTNVCWWTGMNNEQKVKFGAL